MNPAHGPPSYIFRLILILRLDLSLDLQLVFSLEALKKTKTRTLLNGGPNAEKFDIVLELLAFFLRVPDIHIRNSFKFQFLWLIF